MTIAGATSHGIVSWTCVTVTFPPAQTSFINNESALIVLSSHQYPDEGKWPKGTGLYLRDGGEEVFRTLFMYTSGFYELQDECGGVTCRETRSGQTERRLYRAEELSVTPWEEEKDGAPPAYEELSSSSSLEPPAYYSPEAPTIPRILRLIGEWAGTTAVTARLLLRCENTI